ncbi:MAG: cysteine desulfurase [Gammaproteobacteria bacterium]|nr:cysteine desulfurase [Gammaproteobacteria bacterium]
MSISTNPQPNVNQCETWAEAIRAEFPILDQQVHGRPLVFLDSAASSQRPRSVIDAVTWYEEHDHANVHRGVHTLSQRATDAFEGAREKVRNFINAESDSEIVFVSGTTGGINLVASSFGQRFISIGDEIVISHMEHHANIVPWQLLRERTGAVLRVIPMNETGELDYQAYLDMLGPRTRIVALSHVSNALGTINPVKQYVAAAKDRGIPVLLDGAQAVPHMPVDVRDLDCDFYVFSGHKMYGPTGVGVLYGRKQLLDKLPPYQGGGDMILAVSFEKSVYNELPYRLEAGTPNISGAVGLGAAIDFLQRIGMPTIEKREQELLAYATTALLDIPQLRIIGTAPHKAGVLSFVMGSAHPHDIGTILDNQGVAVRTGHHCAMPVMDFFKLPATARASLGVYNTRADIDRLVEALQHVREVLG